MVRQVRELSKTEAAPVFIVFAAQPPTTPQAPTHCIQVPRLSPLLPKKSCVGDKLRVCASGGCCAASSSQLAC